mmetsp:Transcript_27673/g.36305  ORF Transcript_27673/g.36305 Transcript_27673/m.36305 type:complete len:289 (+) Transcript_27673:114-980(+)|eukprot:CAMPEP_0117754568 /NCGR_PEP_ID=MMETSP0947-20121206/12902_1 /TAXON_ID=44440 /ORGANISM="Chattonella subsalsa, Strain CCMP2191" /LENGTH=288 /DNA_ID=CAMNT_0005573673 /DNA_START=38 /DNA_END=904 /DNA_ORIENTATION=+
MAKFLKKASRAVKSEMRRNEALDLADELETDFKKKLNTFCTKKVTSEELDDFIQTKIQEAKTKFKKHVDNSQWKAKEEFNAVLADLPEKLTASAECFRSEQAQKAREEMDDLRTTLLNQLGEALAVPMDSCIPTNQEFEERVMQASSQTKTTFEDFVNNNDLNKDGINLIQDFEEEVSGQVQLAQNKYGAACNERDQKLQEAIDGFKTQNAHSMKKRLQEIFSDALETLQTQEELKYKDFLNTFKSNAEREMGIAARESLTEAKLKHPLPVICSRELFIQKLDDLQIS